MLEVEEDDALSDHSGVSTRGAVASSPLKGHGLQLPISPLEDPELQSVKAKDDSRRRASEDLREALTSVLASPTDAQIESRRIEASEDPEYGIALAHFADTLQKPGDDLTAWWLQKILTLPILEVTEDVAEPELQDLVQRHEVCVQAERHERALARRKQTTTEALDAALKRQERFNKARFHAPGKKNSVRKQLERANADIVQVAVDHNSALEELTEHIEHYVAKAEVAKRHFTEEEAAHIQGLRDATHAAACGLQSWADDAVVCLKVHVDDRGDESTAASDTFHGMSGTSTPSVQTPSSSRDEHARELTSTRYDLCDQGLSSELLEQHARQAASENDTLRQSLLELRPELKDYPHEPFMSRSSVASEFREDCLLDMIRSNQDLERSLHELRPQHLVKPLWRLRADLEHEVFALESLSHMCVALAGESGKGEDSSCSTAEPSFDGSLDTEAATMGVMAMGMGAMVAADLPQRERSAQDIGKMQTAQFGDSPTEQQQQQENLPMHLEHTSSESTLFSASGSVQKLSLPQTSPEHAAIPSEAAANPGWMPRSPRMANVFASFAKGRPQRADPSEATPANQPQLRLPDHAVEPSDAPVRQVSGRMPLSPRMASVFASGAAFASRAKDTVGGVMSPRPQGPDVKPIAKADGSCDPSPEGSSSSSSSEKDEEEAPMSALEGDAGDMLVRSHRLPSDDEVDPDAEDADVPMMQDERCPSFSLGQQDSRASLPFAELMHGESRSPRDALGPGQRAQIMDQPETSDMEGLETGTPRGSMLEPSIARTFGWGQREFMKGLLGCLPTFEYKKEPVRKSLLCARSENEHPSVETAFAAAELDVALAQSDIALYRARLSPDIGHWNWEWGDYAAEEQHDTLQRSTHKLTESLCDTDLRCFAYELLLLCHEALQQGDPVLEHVRVALPICRVRLGITTAQHLHIAALILPEEGSSCCYPVMDIRFRAAMLMKSWMQAESSCFGPKCFADNYTDTQSWIRRQLTVLRGSVILRAITLHRERRESARAACDVCLSALSTLEDICNADRWGKPNTNTNEGLHEPSGRRLIVALMHDLDAMRPSKGDWRLGTIFAAKAFSELWSAAADSGTDDYLSLDAPQVAAALLSGLHPLIGTPSLDLDTHALLLTQQVWKSLPDSSGQLPEKPLQTAAKLLENFSEWIQTTPVKIASCFARRASLPSMEFDWATGTALRRLLSLELRDGLVQKLRDYRLYLEPDAFKFTLSLWKNSHRQTTRSELLIQQSEGEHDQESEHEDSAVELPIVGREAEVEEFLRRMGHWFIWHSIRATAQRAMAIGKAPELNGEPGDWQRKGQAIKRYMEELAAAVQTLHKELEFEQKCYNAAWEQVGLGTDHLGIVAAALSEEVRPKIEELKAKRVWPDNIQEVPPGGGRLLHALEGLDRLANQHPDPREEHGSTRGSLVDMLSNEVKVAMRSGFEKLDREIISHALDGSNDIVFKPLHPPLLLHCEGVVTLWRFIYDAVDSPQALGVPVDLVIDSFCDFLGNVLKKIGPRLLRPIESPEQFRLAARSKKVIGELAKHNDRGTSDDDDDEGGATPSMGDKRGRSGKRNGAAKLMKKALGRGSNSDLSSATRHVIIEADLLVVKPETVVAPGLHEVSVRLSSLGFCLDELKAMHKRLKNAINSGDDKDRPTHRVSAARIKIIEELPQLEDQMQNDGVMLVQYLATRLVFWEMKAEIFEKLYHVVEVKGSKKEKDGETTPRGGTSGGMTPTSSQPACPTLEELIDKRRNGLLALVRQTPAPFVMAFVMEFATCFANAWCFLTLDYMRRQKRDRLVDYLDDDQEALRKLLDDMVEEAESHTKGDIEEEVLRMKQHNVAVLKPIELFLVRVPGSSTEEIARLAEKMCAIQELQAASSHGAPSSAETRARTPPPQRGTSPSPGPTAHVPPSPRRGSASARSPSPYPMPADVAVEYDASGGEHEEPQSGRKRAGNKSVLKQLVSFGRWGGGRSSSKSRSGSREHRD